MHGESSINSINAGTTSEHPPRRHWVAVLLLTLLTLMAHANAWHDAVVFDDRAFFGPDRRVVLESLPEAFERELWGGGGYGYGLYRPLLLIHFELENRVFGDWLRGYHAVNVLLNLAVTLLLYGFLAALMRRSGVGDRAATLAAVLAALAFAVHPAHAEVVNSAFNRSSMFVALFAIGGLWWLFHYLERRPAIAWTGFGLLYTVSIFFKAPYCRLVKTIPVCTLIKMDKIIILFIIKIKSTISGNPDSSLFILQNIIYPAVYKA